MSDTIYTFSSLFYKRFLKPTVLSCLIGSSSILCAAELDFSGNSLHSLEVTPDKNTGLDMIYILYDISGVSAHFKSENPGNVKWYRYSNLGGAFAEEESDISVSDNYSVLNTLTPDSGYIVEDGDKRSYFWIVNYKPYRFAVSDLSVSSSSDCDRTVIDFIGNAEPIHYFTINGQQRVLSRELKLTYENQVWNQQNSEFETTSETKTLEYVSGQISVTPPALISTYYELTGDRFLEAWNWQQSLQTSVADPTAVEVHAIAEQKSKGEDDNPSNEIKVETAGDALGGSAPAEIDFYARVSQGVIHHEWQMSKSPDFEPVDLRINDQDFSYTFNEEGTFYVRYIGSNAAGSCESTSDTFTVQIGASELRIPNAFSPDGDGVNDEWKVSYRSLIDFECWIFDKQGHQLAHLTSPDQGWDGKRGGKTVRSGVYYYIIQATGADGRKYKKSGDINILMHKKFTNTSEQE